MFRVLANYLTLNLTLTALSIKGEILHPVYISGIILTILINVCTLHYTLRYLWADRPDPPSQPMITDVSGTSITLRWDPPQDDGGCRVSNYIIEYFRVSCKDLSFYYVSIWSITLCLLCLPGVDTKKTVFHDTHLTDYNGCPTGGMGRVAEGDFLTHHLDPIGRSHCRLRVQVPRQGWKRLWCVGTWPGVSASPHWRCQESYRVGVGPLLFNSVIIDVGYILIWWGRISYVRKRYIVQGKVECVCKTKII